MKLELILKPCPWCGLTPEIQMPIPDDKTWIWKIRCESACCSVNPEGKGMNFRNTSKTIWYLFLEKVERMIAMWNGHIVFPAHEKKVIDLKEIMYNFKNIPPDAFDSFGWISFSE